MFAYRVVYRYRVHSRTLLHPSVNPVTVCGLGIGNVCVTILAFIAILIYLVGACLLIVQMVSMGMRRVSVE